MKIKLQNIFELGYQLALRDFSSLYRLSFLGVFWGVAGPLVTSLSFILLQRSNIINIPELSISYPAYVISGTLIWQLFVDSLNAPLNQVQINKSVLTKIQFPWLALIVSGFINIMINFSLKFIPIILVLMIFENSFSFQGFLVIIPILGISFFGFLIGIYVLPIVTLFEDLKRVINLVTGPLVFLTPALYQVPDSGILNLFIKNNPLTPFFLTARSFLFNLNDINSIESFLIIMIIILFLFIPGCFFYNLSMPILIERMEN